MDNGYADAKKGPAKPREMITWSNWISNEIQH
jgi:hypothetical protein